MLRRRIIYFILFVFFTWLALATRKHHDWFNPFIVEYGGDTIWAGMFLFFLRCLFPKTTLWKLAVINYILGVLDECSQLYHGAWIVALRHTTIGRLMLGVGFLWSDIICYAVGTLLAFIIAIWIDRITAG